MKVVQSGYKILRPKEWNVGKLAIYEIIEEAGRTCYKSEKDITPESSAKFVKHLVENGHESVLEHAHMTVRFIVDRGISHELVRHRIASYSQESTRYCNYSKDKFGNEIAVVIPGFMRFDIGEVDMNSDRPFYKARQNASEGTKAFVSWYNACQMAENRYFEMLEHGSTPQEARDVLPTSLKTEIVMTANMREWRNIFKLRAAGENGKPHPQMLEVMVPLLKEVREHMPELFGDILLKEEKTHAEQERIGTGADMAEK